MLNETGMRQEVLPGVTVNETSVTTVAYVMPAAQGILTLAGQPVFLRWAAREQIGLTAATGVIGLTGCDVTMPITRRPPVIVQENLKFGRSVYVSRW